MSFTDEQKEIIRSEIEKLTQSYKAELEAKYALMQKSVFENLDIETLKGVIFLNKNLTELQKSQVLAILQGPKHDFTYFQ